MEIISIETTDSQEDEPDNLCDLEDPPELQEVRLSQVKIRELETFTRKALMFGLSRRERLMKQLKKDKLRLLVEVLEINKKIAALDEIAKKKKEKKDS